MKRIMIMLGVMMALVLAVLPLQAQDEPVTADDVNEIASKMYCPVCENIPLDTCETAACADWRNEIRIMLEDGLTEAQIVDDFVLRFGDRVVGVPLDETLRALSLWTPVILVVLTLAAVVWFALKQQGKGHVLDTVRQDDPQPTLDDWRAQIEADVQGATP